MSTLHDLKNKLPKKNQTFFKLMDEGYKVIALAAIDEGYESEYLSRQKYAFIEEISYEDYTIAIAIGF